MCEESHFLRFDMGVDSSLEAKCSIAIARPLVRWTQRDEDEGDLSTIRQTPATRREIQPQIPGVLLVPLESSIGR
jgi:hypothetical protein